MNPILAALNLRSQPNRQQATQFNGTAQDAKSKVLSMVDNMSQQQKAAFAKMLPAIGRAAQAKGVDTSALSELQARM